jgi:hypothetical protein
MTGIGGARTEWFLVAVFHQLRALDGESRHAGMP